VPLPSKSRERVAGIVMITLGYRSMMLGSSCELVLRGSRYSFFRGLTVISWKLSSDTLTETRLE